MDLDFSSTLSMLLCVETSFTRGVSITLSIQHVIFPFLASSSKVHITHVKILLVQITHHLLALCFTPQYYCIENLFCISMIQIANQFVLPVIFQSLYFASKTERINESISKLFFLILSCKVMNLLLHNIQPILQQLIQIGTHCFCIRCSVQVLFMKLFNTSPLFFHFITSRP